MFVMRKEQQLAEHLLNMPLCIFCNCSHKSEDCPTVVDTVKRIEILLKKELCLVCMSHNRILSCPRESVICRMCNKMNHHVAICYLKDLKSPRTTNWGDWKNWEDCPDGTYAYAAKHKVEDPQGKGDDTGLNAVALFCNPLNWATYSTEREILSGEGDWGDWKAVQYCPEGLVMIGFALRSEITRRGQDDVAADNFRGYCGTPDGPRDHSHSFSGDTPGWGRWTEDKFCPLEFAVCGINSQIEGAQRRGDDTALNNIDLRCCRVPPVNLSCTPSYTLQQLAEYDNRLGAGTIQFQYQKKISFSKTTGSTHTVGREEKEAVLSKVTTGVEISTEGITSGLTVSKTSSVNTEHSHGHETISTDRIRTILETVMSNEETITETYNVPAHKGVIIQQLFMTCGIIKVGLPKVVIKSS
ncbi:hypothetical protein L3Y34_011751 [Caenorhabditis briggsae]|uniref:Uncharacterized protein n=1 Tax=Caenorhabditis briggsae TaxID=6238 RepID=A0AAE8ZX32_CAEBR|nr:hypothetical protein L3Y34_011751 [Caenorhabditis briggsae]